MRTLGIDLASDPKNTAACVIEWMSSAWEIKFLHVHMNDADILSLAAGCDSIGIDAPFGWPMPFVEFISQVQTGTVAPPAWKPEWRDSLCLRLTDKRVKEWCGINPLRVSADRIAVTAMRCVGLLATLEVEDRSGDGRVFEVYPAAALRAWGYSEKGLKDKDTGPMMRKLLMEQLAINCTGMRLDDESSNACIESDHALDALIAALVTRAAACGLTIRPEEHEMQRAKIEGWIAVPKPGTLRHLSVAAWPTPPNSLTC